MCDPWNRNRVSCGHKQVSTALCFHRCAHDRASLVATCRLRVWVCLLSYSMSHWGISSPSSSRRVNSIAANSLKVCPLVHECGRQPLTSACSGGQSEHRAKGHHCHWPRWTCVSARPSVHPWQHDPLLHRTRHASERAHVRSRTFHIIAHTLTL
jgi:hypothetical protein